MTPARPEDERRAPVMRDVARLAGVSHQTVSRVLNGSPLVSDRIRQRVETAVEQLGYRRNASARALASRRTMNLGVISIGTSLYGPSVLLFEAAEAARQAGYTTSLFSLADASRGSMRAALDNFTRDFVDGMILIAPVTAAANAVEGMSADVPLVRFEPGLDNGTTMVAVDEVEGARLATRHLLQLGHRTVHQVSGPPGWLGTEARLKGWREELSAAGRVAHDPIVGDWSSASGYRAGKQLAQDPDVTAVFVANDQTALGVLQALDESGVSVPEQISVVGFDNTPESAFYQPPLTTVRLDFAEVGRRCVGRLLQLINNHELEPQPIVAPELVVRASSAAPGR